MTDLESIYITIESDVMATYKVRYYLASQVDEYIKSLQQIQPEDTPQKLIGDLASMNWQYDYMKVVDRAKRLVERESK